MRCISLTVCENCDGDYILSENKSECGLSCKTGEYVNVNKYGGNECNTCISKYPNCESCSPNSCTFLI